MVLIMNLLNNVIIKIKEVLFFMKSKFFIIIFSQIYFTSLAFSLNNLNGLPGIPPAHGTTSSIVHDQYDVVRNLINLNILQLNDISNALTTFCGDLETSLGTNNASLITQLRNIHARFGNSIHGLPNNNIFSQHFRSMQSIILNRIKKAKIDEAILNNEARMNDFNFINIPPAAQAALNILVGAIFHISETEDGIQRVSRVGSGIAVPNGIKDNIGNVINLNTSNIGTILTCGHVLAAKPHQKIKIYFVPKRSLHFSGWPRPDLLIGYNKAAFINFLQTHNEAFRLNPFLIKRNIVPPNLTSQPFVEHSQPQYFQKEDAALASIAYRHEQPHLQIAQNVTLRIINDHENYLNNLRVNQEYYFAIGFPGMHHHLTNLYFHIPEAQAYQNWVTQKGKSPLIVSRQIAQNNGQAFPSLANGRIRHNASTAKGMSGGTLVALSVNGAIPCINIFGIITSGNINVNHATFW